MKEFKEQGFWSLFVTQFLGALNDNLFKNALVVMITFKGLSVLGLSTESVVALAGGLFILPFFIFSASAGQLADRIPQNKLILTTKIWELFVMILAGIGFYFQSTAFLLAILFLMGTQSTFFGPVKYSILPRLLQKNELTKGNAYVEMGTFVAILLGTILGALFYTLGSFWTLWGSLIVVALLGIYSAWKIPETPISDPGLKLNINIFSETRKILALSCESTPLFNTILGISWFWFFGAAILSLLPIYGKDVLWGGESVVTVFLCTFTIGVGLGSFLSEKLSFNKVEIGLVPFGSLGITLFLLDLFWISPAPIIAPDHLYDIPEFLKQEGSIRILIDFLGLSVAGGLFIVPLYTYLQEKSPEKTRSRIIAANNIINALFMVLASLLLIVLYKLDFAIREIFGVLALLNFLVTVRIYTIVPEFALRFLTWILVHCFYRVQINGRNHIPEEGPALLSCNHISFVDWLVISGGIQRPIRFVMYYKFFHIPLVKFLMKDAKVIPIAAKKENPELLEKAMYSIHEALNEGELVCIFPEGKITHDGKLNVFRPGIQKIIEKNPVPIIPMALNGLWGSIFSRKKQKSKLKLPRKFMQRLELLIDSPISPENFSLDKLRLQTSELSKQELGSDR